MANKTPNYFLARGDVAGLLKYRAGKHGSTTMSSPEPSHTGDTVTVPKPQAPPAPVRTFTQEDIDAAVNKAQSELRGAYDPQLENLTRQQQEALNRISAFDTDLADRQKAAEDAAAEAERIKEEKRVAELSFADKLAEVEGRFTGQLSGLEQTIQQQQATLAKERQFSELSAYRAQLITDNADNIFPEMHDYVTGNTQEEIQASLAAAVERTAKILGNTQRAQQAQRAAAPGVGITAPATGPMDIDSGYQSFSSQDISNMSMAEYAKHRASLLGAGSRSPQDRGMLG